MQKQLLNRGTVVAVIILFIGMGVVPATSASLDDDIEIYISAGLNNYLDDPTKRTLGFCICNM
ncbi:MAG: hypothetical protein JSW60_03730 [Thermoplasmatales archaeon]|nr:MAG: hypothetical protein JSW60_03730 [Thermoplasmatales archaeon]